MLGLFDFRSLGLESPGLLGRGRFEFGHPGHQGPVARLQFAGQTPQLGLGRMFQVLGRADHAGQLLLAGGDRLSLNFERRLLDDNILLAFRQPQPCSAHLVVQSRQPRIKLCLSMIDAGLLLAQMSRQLGRLRTDLLQHVRRLHDVGGGLDDSLDDCKASISAALAAGDADSAKTCGGSTRVVVRACLTGGLSGLRLGLSEVRACRLGLLMANRRPCEERNEKRQATAAGMENPF